MTMRKLVVVGAAAILSLGVGGTALAASNGVDDQSSGISVRPVSTSSPSHDVNDDHGINDDHGVNAGQDVNDDHGGNPTRGVNVDGINNGINIDVNDDHGVNDHHGGSDRHRGNDDHGGPGHR